MSIRPDPFEQMESMFEQMRRAAFDSWGGHTWDDQGRPALRGQSALERKVSETMRISLEEDDDGYVVFADVPGFEREEIDLALDDDVLTITATHDVSDDDSFRRRSVHESVRVPANVDVEAANATYRNGVLEVRLPVEDDTDGGRRIETD